MAETCNYCPNPRNFKSLCISCLVAGKPMVEAVATGEGSTLPRLEIGGRCFAARAEDLDEFEAAMVERRLVEIDKTFYSSFFRAPSKCWVSDSAFGCALKNQPIWDFTEHAGRYYGRQSERYRVA